MIPNKTEEQILYQQFKYYDLDSSGLCSLQNFIRTNSRLGVVLPQIKDFEIVFNYFANPETSLLDYKNFISEIFNFKFQKNSKNQNFDSKTGNDTDFISVLSKKLLEKGGTFPLIELTKNLEIVDYEGNKRISADDFLKVLQRSKIFLNTNEIQLLFQSFDFFINGIVKYQILINILLDLFWNDKKLSLSEEIFYLLTGNGRTPHTLNSMKNYFDNVLEDSIEKRTFLKFIDEYKLISKANPSQKMSLTDVVIFLKYYSFGQKSYSYLEDLINILKPDVEINDNFVDENKNNFDDKKKINNVLYKGYENEQLNQLTANLREKFIKLGRKTFFNFIKHFKYYDNNTKCITKYDFSKVLKDFNIKVSVDDMDNLFKIFATDKTLSSMKYEDFINCLTMSYISDYRKDIINLIFNTIEERAFEHQKELNIPLLKEIYNAKNNFFKKEESDNRVEFEDCLEIYHFCYKNLKNEKFSKSEFEEFYFFISFLVYNDDDFIYNIANEWRVPLDYVKNFDQKLLINKLPEKNIQKNLSNISRLPQVSEQTNDYQNDNLNQNYNTNKDSQIKLNRKDFEGNTSERTKYNKINRQNKNNNYFQENKNNNNNNTIDLLTEKLRNRGLRGILYLYNQFLSSCADTNKITLNDFINVLKIQHFNFNIDDYQKLFNTFSNNKYLDFYSFIRNYKKELNDKKLSVVEKVYSKLDSKGTDKIPIDFIKLKYNANNHPEVISGKKNEEDKLMEFLDCFSLCYDLLGNDNNEKGVYGENQVDFETFANFYEYVAFIYPRDDIFENVVLSTWS